jgi:hypothetical protein
MIGLVEVNETTRGGENRYLCASLLIVSQHNILGTLLELDGKNKDTVNARIDLKKFNVRKRYWLKKRGIVT